MLQIKRLLDYRNKCKHTIESLYLATTMLLYSNMTRPPVLRGITIQISLPIPPFLRALTSSSMLVIILFSSIPLVFGHGGMLWPPSWQNGQYKSIEMVDSNDIASDTPVIDPTTNREIRKTTAFLTDHTFVSGHGLEYAFVGEKTNQEIGKKGYCATTKTPWASPGRAPSLGGGCGLFRGDPNRCEGGCTIPRAVFSQGSSALDIEFPEAATTERAGRGQDEQGWAPWWLHIQAVQATTRRKERNHRRMLCSECAQVCHPAHHDARPGESWSLGEGGAEGSDGGDLPSRQCLETHCKDCKGA